MVGVKGRDIFLSKAVPVSNETVAFSYRIRAQMMAGYRNNVKQIKEFRNIQGIVPLQTIDHVLVIIVLVDYGLWTRKRQGKFEAFKERSGPAQRCDW